MESLIPKGSKVGQGIGPKGRFILGTEEIKEVAKGTNASFQYVGERGWRCLLDERLYDTPYDLPLLLEKLLTLYDTEPDRQALMLFINWFRQLAAHGRLKSVDFAQIEEQELTREEVKSMLIKALERERELIFDSGKQEGIQERNRQIVQAMVGNGFPLPTIATLLNLSLSEVEQLLARATPIKQVDDSDTAG